MTEDILRVENLRAAYGKVVALNGVSLRVGQGEVVAVLGSNGAGKSTLLNCISGVVPVAGGNVVLDGRTVTGRKPWDLSRMGVSHVPEGREIFPALTVEENLLVVEPRPDGPPFMIEDVLLMFPRLRERLHQNAGNLSGGEQQMLAVGRGLMARPRLMMFDEPSLGLSPVISKLVLSAIAGLKTRGIACVLVEQNIRAALKVADRAYVLRVGNLVQEGTAQQLLQSSELEAAYLGA